MENHIYYDTTINAAFATIMSLKIDPYKTVTRLQDIHKKQK
ncbi:hypothetical protein [Buchnera aphidicola]